MLTWLPTDDISRTTSLGHSRATFLAADDPSTAKTFSRDTSPGSMLPVFYASGQN